MNDELHGEGGSSRAERFWEWHYCEHERVWSGMANAVLGDFAESLPPGTALDLSCGEGGDAILLARLGWRVTGVDESATALDRASTHAATAGWRHGPHRLPAARPLPHLPRRRLRPGLCPVPALAGGVPRDRVLRAAARVVAPGGLLLIVDHGSVRPWAWNPDPNTHFPTPEEVLASLDLSRERWRTELLRSPERRAIGPNGQSATVTDNVIAIKGLTR